MQTPILVLRVLFMSCRTGRGYGVDAVVQFGIRNRVTGMRLLVTAGWSRVIGSTMIEAH